MVKGCIFCEPKKYNLRVICQSEHFYSQFDKYPVSPGHSEIIPKRHVISLTDLTEEEWEDLLPAIKDTIGFMKATDLNKLYSELVANPLNEKSKELCEAAIKHPGLNQKPDAYNYGINDGEAAGRTIHHLHIHIIPRFHGDVEDPVGGVRNIFPDVGNYKK